MKGFGGPTPFLGVLLAIFAFFWDTRKRRPTRRVASGEKDIWEEEKEQEMKQNTAAVRRMVAAHADCTAEVFNISAFGWGKVHQLRKVRPGDPVEVRRYDGQFKVFVAGRYIEDFYPGQDSLLPRIFDEDIPFEAYLGGRDMQNAYVSTDYDSCTIIVFYRIPGIPPTKVNLES